MIYVTPEGFSRGPDAIWQHMPPEHNAPVKWNKCSIAETLHARECVKKPESRRVAAA